MLTTLNKDFNSDSQVTICETLLPVVKRPKVLGVFFDTSLNFAEHYKRTANKAMRKISVLKALSGSNWGQSSENINVFFFQKTLIRPILEYACTAWSHAASDTSISKIQILQNAAVRRLTGCTKMTPNGHLHSEWKLLNVKSHHKLLPNNSSSGPTCQSTPSIFTILDRPTSNA